MGEIFEAGIKKNQIDNDKETFRVSKVLRSQEIRDNNQESRGTKRKHYPAGKNSEFYKIFRAIETLRRSLSEKEDKK
ncbi:MAG: hypothetical protein PHU42_02500 [Patescibacteria group bacterium]|nr:hypothetical protein [Patescibacteria group bacterium]